MTLAHTDLWAQIRMGGRKNRAAAAREKKSERRGKRASRKEGKVRTVETKIVVLTLV